MTSPRPPVLEKGAHSAPTITTFSRSWSAFTTRDERECERLAGARLATTAARLKEEANEEDERQAMFARKGAVAACVVMFFYCCSVRGEEGKGGWLGGREGVRVMSVSKETLRKLRHICDDDDDDEVAGGWILTFFGWCQR